MERQSTQVASALADLVAVIQAVWMKITTLPTVLLAVLASTPSALAQTSAHSSPEDRQRFVSIERSLERAPLDSSLQASNRGVE